MKASPAAQKELLKLQAVDTRLQQLDHSAKTLPQLASIAALANDLEEVKQRLARATGQLEDARTELSRIESDVQLVESRIQRNTARAEQTASAKDAQALESEHASLEKRRNDLEEIELTVMERIEALEADLAGIESERETILDQAESLEQAKSTELERIEQERQSNLAERATILESIPVELHDLYEKQRTRYGVGAGLLRGGVSGGSNMALTESDLAVIRQAAPDEVVLDPESGCILVRTEESGL